MTIKQQGGIFGRNPTFNDVEVEGDLTLSGSISLPNDSISGDAIDGGNATLEGLTVGDTGSSFTGVFIVSSTSGESELRMGDTDTDAGSIAYRNDTNEMTFRTNAAPRATLDGSGNFEPTGNVVLANGKGIDFSATSGTGTSELFDDYEEGTWTPTLLTGTATATDAVYTKIGNMVYARATLSSFSDRTTSSNVTVRGLPYAPASASSGGSMLSRNTSVATPIPLTSTGDYTSFYANSTGGYVTLQHVNLTSSSAAINFNLVYRA